MPGPEFKPHKKKKKKGKNIPRLETWSLHSCAAVLAEAKCRLQLCGFSQASYQVVLYLASFSDSLQLQNPIRVHVWAPVLTN
jgi:hypothetical protein